MNHLAIKNGIETVHQQGNRDQYIQRERSTAHATQQQKLNNFCHFLIHISYKVLSSMISVLFWTKFRL
jgi:hypothetical protein